MFDRRSRHQALAASRALSIFVVSIAVVLAARTTFAQADAGTRGDAAVRGDAGPSADASASAVAVDPRASEARGAFERGVALSQEERWGEALEEFRRSMELVERPSTAFNMATTLVRLGRHVEAVRAFERYVQLADPVADAARFASVQEQLVAERAIVATVQLTVEPATAELRVDGRAASETGASRTLTLDPGSHTIELSAPRHRAFSTAFRLTNGERRAIDARLEAVTLATLEVSPSVSSALVTVDGITFGRGPRQVPAGAHEINVTAVGYDRYRRRVTLEPESTLRVDAALQRTVVVRPLHANPVFWAAVGGGVAVVATAVILGVALTTQAPELGTSTGIVIQGLSDR